MSRIEEALRRAASESSGATANPQPPVPESATGTEVATLAREPFPVELTDVRVPAADPPASKSVPTLDTSIEEPAAARVEANQAGRLFDTLDATLAEKVVADDNMAPTSREQYRRLAAVLHDAQANSGLRVVMIASALPGEGKTLTASNLALTLSESYQDRVLLIDADLRRPTLHQIFRLQTSAGLIEGLESEKEIKLVLRRVSPRLSVLPAGRPTSDPMAGLTSDRMKRLIEEAKETFDWVIIDTPPLMLLPDAHLLSSMVDGVLLVVKASSTPHELVKRAADIIGRQRVTGVVLNHAEARQQPGYSGDYYQDNYYLRRTATLERP